MLEQNILIGGEESGGIGTNLYIPNATLRFSACSWRSDGLARQIAWRVAGRAYRRVWRVSLRRVDLDLKPSQKEKAIAPFRMPTHPYP